MIGKNKGKARMFAAVALLGAVGSVAAVPPAGTCTEANQGQFATDWFPGGGSNTYQCDLGEWRLWAVCDNRGHCVIVI